MMEEDVIGIKNLDTGIGSAGVGFVVVPSEVDRVQYINDCYRTNTLTINGGKGYGYFSGVHADINVMQCIKFPTDEENRGTPVVWVKDAVSQLPVIVAVLRKQGDYYSLDENQYRLKRGTETRNVEIFVDGNTAGLDITILGDKEEPANIDIKLSSENSDSVLNVSCDNEINIIGNKSVNVVSNSDVKVSIKDKGDVLTFIEAKKEQVNIVSKQIIHSSGKEHMVLGDTLAQLLKDMLSAIMKITVPTPVGSSGTPINTAEFNSISNRVDDILSEISKIE